MITEWIRFFIFLDQIYMIDGILFACGETASAEGHDGSEPLELEPGTEKKKKKQYCAFCASCDHDYY